MVGCYTRWEPLFLPIFVPGNYMLLLKHEQLKSYVKTAYKSIYANIKFNPTSSFGNPFYINM